MVASISRRANIARTNQSRYPNDATTGWERDWRWHASRLPRTTGRRDRAEFTSDDASRAGERGRMRSDVAKPSIDIISVASSLAGVLCANPFSGLRERC